jgi:hypothetical protein
MKIGDAVQFKAAKGSISISRRDAVKGTLVLDENLPAKEAYDLAKRKKAEAILVVDQHQNALGVVIPGKTAKVSGRSSRRGGTRISVDKFDLYLCPRGSHVTP